MLVMGKTTSEIQELIDISLEEIEKLKNEFN